jgi:hypothetical protein
MTLIRPFEHRIWRLYWQWLIDIYAVNAFLIWQRNEPDKTYRAYRKFREALTNQLLRYPKEGMAIIQTPTAANPSGSHSRVRWPDWSYCAWCKDHLEDWQPSDQGPRKFGTELDPNSAGRAVPKRGSNTYSGCQTCKVYLCVKGECWRLWHDSLLPK